MNAKLQDKKPACKLLNWKGFLADLGFAVGAAATALRHITPLPWVFPR